MGPDLRVKSVDEKIRLALKNYKIEVLVGTKYVILLTLPLHGKRDVFLGSSNPENGEVKPLLFDNRTQAKTVMETWANEKMSKSQTETTLYFCSYMVNGKMDIPGPITLQIRAREESSKN